MAAENGAMIGPDSQDQLVQAGVISDKRNRTGYYTSDQEASWDRFQDVLADGVFVASDSALGSTLRVFARDSWQVDELKPAQAGLFSELTDDETLFDIAAERLMQRIRDTYTGNVSPGYPKVYRRGSRDGDMIEVKVVANVRFCGASRRRAVLERVDLDE